LIFPNNEPSNLESKDSKSGMLLVSLGKAQTNNELCSQQFFSLSLETLFLSLIRAYGEKNGTSNSLINIALLYKLRQRRAPLAKKLLDYCYASTKKIEIITDYYYYN